MNWKLLEVDWERSIRAFLLQLLLYEGPPSPHHPSMIRFTSIRWTVVTTPMQALSRVSTITQLWLAMLHHSKKVVGEISGSRAFYEQFQIPLDLFS